MEQELELISKKKILEITGNAFADGGIDDWDEIEEAPKRVKLGPAANSRSAYVKSEVLAYFALLVGRRKEALAKATASARRAGKISAERRALMSPEQRAQATAMAKARRAQLAVGQAITIEAMRKAALVPAKRGRPTRAEAAAKLAAQSLGSRRSQPAQQEVATQ